MAAFATTEAASLVPWTDLDIGFNARYIHMRHVGGAGDLDVAMGKDSTSVVFKLSAAAGTYSQEIQIENEDGISTIRHKQNGAAASIRITAWK